MNTREAIANRILELCKERGITPNALSNISAVPQATIKSILNGESQNPGAVTIKKLCDGFEITLGQFYSSAALPRFKAALLLCSDHPSIRPPIGMHLPLATSKPPQFPDDNAALGGACLDHPVVPDIDAHMVDFTPAPAVTGGL